MSETQSLIEWAESFYAESPTWIEFHAAMWAALDRAFPSRTARQAFLVSPDGARLQTMLAALRQRQDHAGDKPPTVTVTVRLPLPLHQSLVAEAKQANLRLHRLCLAKLAQPLVEV